MNPANCLNFCEILPYLKKKRSLWEIYADAMKAADFQDCERIYIGTSFCGKYFLHQQDGLLKEIFAMCQDKELCVTLVIPTFSEGDLEEGKKKIAHILELGANLIDEITVNDVGALRYEEQFQKKMNLGRLFMKDYRDPRYTEYFQIPWKPKMFTDYMKEILVKYNVQGCEMDMTHKLMDFSQMPKELTAGIHIPYTYQTVGRICEYASIQKEVAKKFRANDACQENCASHLLKYVVSDGDMEYVRFGRTIYFKQKGFEVNGLQKYRIIYFPIDL
ncbi:hypothetical protein [[Clostridium] polysaccharolyticum]|uniref:Uncharacterized protein n=1 Tax=[Clostridium] polysaccharolyticum TaxID=29364 RepID=A0A1I0DKF0_9FIRM|nr:hypothetical protein [[Clostridium] polysaccharolyticum]SET32631.1 hypothetical protein SAMN04487772_11521 [[Clostridium] polysaccharolyticum]